MDDITGEMKTFLPDEFTPKRFTPLPNLGRVLKIDGHNFVVESYDTENRKMILRGISKDEAKFILMGGKR